MILYTVSATSVQLLERRIPDLELNTFRSGIPLIFYSIGLFVMRRWPIIERSQIGVALLYSLVGSSSKMGEFVAMTFLPAATVSCVYSTSSIISGLLLYALCLKELATLRKMLFAAICVCGVILVIQPWIENEGNISNNETTKLVTDDFTNIGDSFIETNLTHKDSGYGTLAGSKTSFQSNSSNTFSPVSLFSEITGYTAVISGGILVAVDVLMLKKYPYISANPLEILFWVWSFGTTVSLILMFIIETPVLPSNWFDLSMVIIHSATCAAIWPLGFYGSTIVTGNTFSLILSTQVVFMLIAQYTVLSSISPGQRNWMEVVGVIFVLLGSSLSSVLETLANRK